MRETMKSIVETARELKKRYKESHVSKEVLLITKQEWTRQIEFLEKKQKEIDNFEEDATNGFGQDDFDIDLDDMIKELKLGLKILAGEEQ